MVLPVTPEEQEKYRALNRIRMKLYRDHKRVRKYSPHPTVMKKIDESVQSNEVKKDERI